MTGKIWMFSHLVDAEDLDFGKHEFITYKMGQKYYGMGEKKFIIAAWKSGAVYKCGKLRMDHVEYVLKCLKENTTKVRNVRKYMLAALFQRASDH